MLADPDDPAHVAPFAHILAGIGGVLPRVVDSYRTGAGVPYHAYGRDFRHGQGHINRPAFTRELPTEWLAAMPDVVARLETARHARVADVGCGQGFSTIAVAQAFLDAHVDGLDADAGSIADARAPRPRRRVWTAASASCRPTPPSSPATARTTSFSSSRRCTT